jgi:glycosyltransferase involved in cell wall biosynthesis
MDEMIMIALSVVLISKNQAWNICRLIESILAGTTCVSSKEVILVDSASTDATVTLAKEYPIRILRLQADQHLSPAAGRYVGYQHTTGALVLFLDGDQELYPGWVEKALEVMRQHADIAAVAGPCIPLAVDAGEAAKPPVPQMTAVEGIDAMHCGGAAMFRRSILDKVGTFNPYLYSDEEPELCIRLRHAGYRIFKLHHPIAYEYTDCKEELRTKMARWRRNLYLGAGQVIRYHLCDDIFWWYLKERGFGLAPIFGLLGGSATFVWYLASGQHLWWDLWLLLLGIVIGGDVYRKRNVSQALVSLVQRLLIADGTIRGFLKNPLPPDQYPAKYDHIQ